jgi:hypothetical protein
MGQKKISSSNQLTIPQTLLIAISVIGCVMLMGLFSLRNGVFLVIAIK